MASNEIMRYRRILEITCKSITTTYCVHYFTW